MTRVSLRTPGFRLVVVLCLSMGGLTDLAHAQSAGAQPTGQLLRAQRDSRVELAMSAVWLGAVAMGERDATLRTNTADGTTRLFSTTSRMAPGAGLEVRAAVVLTPRIAIEGRVSGARTELQTAIGDDVERAAPLTARTEVTEMLVEGGARFDLGGGLGAFRPFLVGGAGYRRQIHEGRVLVQDGIAAHIGGGVRRVLVGRSAGLWRALGVRAEGRVHVLSGGVTFNDAPQVRPSASAGLFIGF